MNYLLWRVILRLCYLKSLNASMNIHADLVIIQFEFMHWGIGFLYEGRCGFGDYEAICGLNNVLLLIIKKPQLRYWKMRLC